MKWLLWPRLNRYIPIWPTPKQAAFMGLPHLEALYGGAAGGGKSVALLAAALMYVDVPGYHALILRRQYRSFEQHGGLVELSKHWLSGTDASWNEAASTWRFPARATLAFRHLREVGHLQGSEFQFIGVDELADAEEPDYLYLFGRLRSRAGSAVPLRMRATSNPIGPGVEWVYERFVMQGRDAGRVFIPASFQDNPHLDRVAYGAALAQLPWFLRGPLEEGRWDIRPEGGLFLRRWFEGCIVEPSHLPAEMTLCRFWDLAATRRRARVDPDHTAGVLLGRADDGRYYVMDVQRAQASDLEAIELITRTAQADRHLAATKGWRSHDSHRTRARGRKRVPDRRAQTPQSRRLRPPRRPANSIEGGSCPAPLGRRRAGGAPTQARGVERSIPGRAVHISPRTSRRPGQCTLGGLRATHLERARAGANHAGAVHPVGDSSRLRAWTGTREGLVVEASPCGDLDRDDGGGDPVDY